MCLESGVSGGVWVVGEMCVKEGNMSGLFEGSIEEMGG